MCILSPILTDLGLEALFCEVEYIFILGYAIYRSRNISQELFEESRRFEMILQSRKEVVKTPSYIKSQNEPIEKRKHC